MTHEQKCTVMECLSRFSTMLTKVKFVNAHLVASVDVMNKVYGEFLESKLYLLAAISESGDDTLLSRIQLSILREM